MVTVELAVGAGGVLICLGAGLGAIAVGVDEVRCVDAAHIAARAASRGDPPGRARALALERAPAGSAVTVDVRSGEAVAVVTARRRSIPMTVAGVTASAAATTPVEADETTALAGPGAGDRGAP